VKRKQLLKIRIPAEPAGLSLARSSVKDAIAQVGCNTDLVDNLVLAVNEACMNVIQHAYKGTRAGEIILEIHNNEDSIVIRVEDHANPIDLDSVKPRNLDELRPGGLGTHFIREIMDECYMGHLEAGAGNYLEMIKKINK
jgi:anti-sigma regulatory factor (Ser/Thr protein kinase)